MRMLFGVAGWTGAWEMRADSRTMRHLFDPTLVEVDIKTFSVRKRGPGATRSLPEAEAGGRRALARFALEGTLPETPRLRNSARSLAQDSRFGEFREHLQDAIASCPRCDRAEQFSRVYDRIMPRPVGSHTSVLFDDGFVDALVAGLVEPVAPGRLVRSGRGGRGVRAQERELASK